MVAMGRLSDAQIFVMPDRILYAQKSAIQSSEEQLEPRIHRAIMWRAIINASVFGGASAWYFYFKPNVAAYFRELREPMT